MQILSHFARILRKVGRGGIKIDKEDKGEGGTGLAKAVGRSPVNLRNFNGSSGIPRGQGIGAETEGHTDRATRA